MENSASGRFQVQVTGRSIVKASNPMEDRIKLCLSNLDLLSGRFPVTYLYFYLNKSKISFSSVVATMKRSLAEVLNYYYPFAGRIIDNDDTKEPEIACNNNGAMFVTCHATISIDEVDFYNLNYLIQEKLISIVSDYPMQVQVTNFSCGGVSITFSFDHALGDASSFGKFLKDWSTVARGMPLSSMPDHRRFLRARVPPSYPDSMNQSYAKCTIEEIMNIPTRSDLIKRLYYIDVSSIDRLQKLASANGSLRTKIEAFSAYVWKIMSTAMDGIYCKMGWLVDGRGRVSESRNMLSNYIGNILSVTSCEAAIDELKSGTMADIASKVHTAIKKATNEEHFLDLIDWIESHRPGLMLSNIVLGRGGPALVVSSGRRFPVAELDFGYGSPALGTTCTTIENIGVAYMNQRPSASNDGSWTISAMLWQELAAALEEDGVFQQIAFRHLPILKQ